MVIGRVSRLRICFLTLLVSFVAGFSIAAEGLKLEGEGLPVSEINIVGNVSISRAEILSAIRTREGELFYDKSVSGDTDRIAAIEGVAGSYYEHKVVNGKVKLTFIVVEENLIRSIIFNGNEAYKDSRLLKESGLTKGDYLDTFLVNSSVRSLVDFYHEKGYANVGISLDRDAFDEGKVIYDIKEGQRVKVKEIKFKGNEAFTGNELSKAIETKKRKYIFWTGYYNEETVQEDIKTLKQVYMERGYRNVKVTVEEKFSKDKDLAYITFIIDEGERYLIDDVEIVGNTFFETETLKENLRLKMGGIYSEDIAEFDAGKIESRYIEAGFVDAEVKAKSILPLEGNTVSVKYVVEEGERYRIGKITVVGNHKVYDKVVRRVLEEEDFIPGEWYNADIARGDGSGELEKLVRRKVMTESTEIKPGEGGETARDAEVRIVEAQTGSIMLGAGVASNSGLIGQLVLDQRNFDITAWPRSLKEFMTGEAFRGAGQRFRISLNPGTEQSSFSVSFTEPYLYDKPVSLDTVASSFERRQEAYDEGRMKGYLGLEKRYRDDWRRGFALRAENVDVDDIDFDAPREIKDVKGDNSLFGVQLYIRKDTTDSRFLPSKGYNFRTGYEQVGGDFTFGVLTATQRWYRTLYEDLGGRKTVLETKLHGGAIIGDAPVFEKFYAGGTGSIRGFDYRGVSDRGLQTNVTSPERKDPIGSDWLVTGSAEVAVPITTEVLSWLFFVDGGLIETGGLRSSVGTGVQILLPQWFGPVPMRFELAAPITKDELDETRVFSFSVGALF